MLKRKRLRVEISFKVYRDKFKQLVSKRQELIDKLNIEEITVEQALKQIQLYHIADTPTLRDFFENEFLNSKPKDYNTERYYVIFNKLETSLQEAKLSHLTPLKIGNFKTHTDEIVNALKRITKKNTATEYLKKLNTVLKAYDENEFRDKYFKKYYETEYVNIQIPSQSFSESSILQTPLKEL